MLDTTLLWDIAARIPRFWNGAVLHRWGLQAAHHGAYDLAERLFEAAAGRYHVELRIEPLACLRAHQLMTRVRAHAHDERAGEWCLEAERLLTRLDRIEALEPPFERVDARSLLATWLPSSSGSFEPERDTRVALAA